MFYFLLFCAETDQNDVSEPGRTSVPEQPDAKGAWRDEKMSESVRHGTPR